MTSIATTRRKTHFREAAWTERLARRLFLRVLRRIEHGRLVIEDPHGRQVFGSEGDSGLEAHVRIHDPSFWSAALLDGSAGVGRSYMEGAWTCEDLARLVRIFARNGEALQRWSRGPARLVAPAQRAALWVRRNTPGGARRNIREHYDLGNDFFTTFLDPSLMYSCAIYPHEKSTLEEAALNKLHRICRKLELGPGDHILEIGTGWGGFALVAAGEYGARVTTTTISEEQHALATERVEAAGLRDRITLLREDYRALRGRFDKLVSIEMIEAVGPDFLEDYFRVCSARLKPAGRMLLQAILIDDRQYARAARSVDFIKRYIFPGSFIPSPHAIARCVAQVTDLRLVHAEDLTPHYARTLRDWHDRFVAASDRVRQMGFDESFLRRWRFYFKYCEGGFEERRLGVQQLMYAKPADRRQAPMGAI